MEYEENQSEQNKKGYKLRTNAVIKKQCVLVFTNDIRNVTVLKSCKILDSMPGEPTGKVIGKAFNFVKNKKGVFADYSFFKYTDYKLCNGLLEAKIIYNKKDKVIPKKSRAEFMINHINIPVFKIRVPKFLNFEITIEDTETGEKITKNCKAKRISNTQTNTREEQD